MQLGISLTSIGWQRVPNPILIAEAIITMMNCNAMGSIGVQIACPRLRFQTPYLLECAGQSRRQLSGQHGARQESRRRGIPIKQLLAWVREKIDDQVLGERRAGPLVT